MLLVAPALLVTLEFGFWVLLLLLVLEEGVGVCSGLDLAGVTGT